MPVSVGRPDIRPPRWIRLATHRAVAAAPKPLLQQRESHSRRPFYIHLPRLIDQHTQLTEDCGKALDHRFSARLEVSEPLSNSAPMGAPGLFFRTSGPQRKAGDLIEQSSKFGCLGLAEGGSSDLYHRTGSKSRAVSCLYISSSDGVIDSIERTTEVTLTVCLG